MAVLVSCVCASGCKDFLDSDSWNMDGSQRLGRNMPGRFWRTINHWYLTVCSVNQTSVGKRRWTGHMKQKNLLPALNRSWNSNTATELFSLWSCSRDFYLIWSICGKFTSPKLQTQVFCHTQFCSGSHSVRFLPPTENNEYDLKINEVNGGCWFFWVIHFALKCRRKYIF